MVHKKHTERTHEELGGSSAAIWSVCTGSVFLKRTIPQQEPTEHTQKGTRAHEACDYALEWFLQHKIDGRSKEGLTKWIEDNTDDHEMFESVIGYITFIWVDVLKSYITDKSWGIEDKFTYSDNIRIGGPTDFWTIYIDNKGKRVLHVVDYKNGRTEVDIIKNKQLGVYATAIREYLLQNGKDIDYVLASVYQPKSSPPNKTTTFKLNQLDSFKKQFLSAHRKVYIEKKPKFKTGSHCLWCHAQSICKDYNKSASLQSDLMILESEIEDNGLPNLPEVGTLSNEDLYKIYKVTKPITEYLKKVNAHIKSLFIVNKPIAGLKAIQAIGRSNWIEDTDIVATKLVDKGLTLDQIFNQKIKGQGVVKAHLKDLGMKPKDIEEYFGQLTLKKPGGIKVVEESAKGEPIVNFDEMILLGNIDETEID